MAESTKKSVLVEMRDYIIRRFGAQAKPAEITLVCNELITIIPDFADDNGDIVIAIINWLYLFCVIISVFKNLFCRVIYMMRETIKGTFTIH